MNADGDTALLRLLQLCSGTLPIGGFTYSQGIEWAVECGWIRNQDDLTGWLADLIDSSLTRVEIPLLARSYRACEHDDAAALQRWCDWLLACRETGELRGEERNRGRALAALLVDLEIPHAREWHNILAQNQSAGFALACVMWHIPLPQAAHGFAWSWMESQTLAGVKLIPLGQTSGQRILRDLSNNLARAVQRGLDLADAELGASAPALAIASSRHETQYTRLFRS